MKLKEAFTNPAKFTKDVATAPVDAAKKAAGGDDKKGSAWEAESLRAENDRLRQELAQRNQVPPVPPTLNANLYSNPNAMGAGFGTQPAPGMVA